MAKFKQINFQKPKLKQIEVADQLGYSCSTLQTFRNYTNMLSTYRILQNITEKRTRKASNTYIDNNSHREHDLRRQQMTPNDLK